MAEEFDVDTFIWDRNFITGLSDVDRQHHELVDLFNELNGRCSMATTPARPNSRRFLNACWRTLPALCRRRVADG
jgi:hypothetical protein